MTPPFTFSTPWRLYQVAVAAVAGGEATATTLKYTGVLQCLRLIAKEEGVGALYRALPPRLISVVPMMGIQVMMLFE